MLGINFGLQPLCRTSWRRVSVNVTTDGITTGKLNAEGRIVYHVFCFRAHSYTEGSQVLRNFTKVMILHPIGAGLSFFAVVWGLVSCFVFCQREVVMANLTDIH